MSIVTKLYCKTNYIRKDGTAPIYLVLRIKNAEKLINTEKYIQPELFDNNTGKVLRKVPDSMKLNNLLNSYKSRLDEIILELQHRKQEVTHEKVIYLYANKGELKYVSFAREELRKERAAVSEKYYHTTTYEINAVEKFDATLTFNQITVEFLHKYVRHLRGKGNGNYTVRSALSRLRKFVNAARRQGLTTQYAFENFTLPAASSEREWLTLTEIKQLHQLYQAETLRPALQNTLFYFLIGCNTGLRFGDVKRLKQARIQKRNAEHYLVVDTAKTGVKVELPLSQPLIQLLMSRLGLQEKDLLKIDLFTQEALFGKGLKVNNNQVNADIRRILPLAGITKDLTFHCSRHTFAINALLLGLNLKAISKFLGHTTIKTTELYARVVDEMQENEMRKWKFD